MIVGEDGSRELHRASDMAKDQSYVLGVWTRSSWPTPSSRSATP